MTKFYKTYLPPILVGAFILLWEFNYELCWEVHPYAWEKDAGILTERGHEQANLFTKLRSKFTVTLYMLGLLIAAVPRTRLSRSMLVGTILIVGCGWIDKVLQNVFISMLRDYMVVWVSAVFISILFYKRKW